MKDPGTSVATTRSTRRRRRITAEQADEIVRLRLQGHSVRETAARVGVHKNTVVAEYQAYLEEVAEQRAADLEVHRAEAITRAERAVATAWEAWGASHHSDDGPDPRFLAEYRQALALLQRLTGAEAASRVELSGPDGGPIELDLAALPDEELRRLAGEG